VEQVLVKAFVPRDLKRRAFGALAIQEETFSAWLRMQLARLVDEDNCGGHGVEPEKHHVREECVGGAR
jgi:hypothetical protein